MNYSRKLEDGSVQYLALPFVDPPSVTIVPVAERAFGSDPTIFWGSTADLEQHATLYPSAKER